MDLVHAILYRIARTVEYGLNITSADFLANMDDPNFTKSRSRWELFAEAVDSEDQFGGFKLAGTNSMLLRIAESSERAVSMPAPSSFRCFTGSMLVGLVPPPHTEHVLMFSSRRQKFTSGCSNK